MPDGNSEVSTRTLTVLVYLVAGAWAINLLAPLFVSGVESSTGANGVMGALIGLLGAARYHASRSKAETKEETTKDE